MYADGSLHFAPPAIQGTQREMRLDRVSVRIHQFQEHVERSIGLLGHDIVEAGEIVRMQFAEGGGPALAPAEVPGQYPKHQRGNHQNPGHEG